jgi:tetrahydromethanopterin S-methyltransferase subunit B
MNLFGIMQIIISVVGFCALVMGGIFGVAGAFDRFKRQRQTELDQDGASLISILKDSVDALSGKVAELEKSAEKNKKRIEELETRNSVLEQIFQGRDQTSADFFKQGFISMKHTEEILLMVEKNNENLEKLYTVIEKHLNCLEAQQK